MRYSRPIRQDAEKSRRAYRRRLPAWIAGILVSVAALLTLGLSRAAVDVVSREAEAGIAQGNAGIIDMMGASATKAVVFGTNNAGPSLYVAPNGDDSNPGTQVAPFKTVQKASEAATPGTTVHVAPGTYSGQVWISRAGAADGWIRYVSEARHAAKLRYVHISAQYISFEGFEIGDPSERNGMGIEASNTVIRDNRIHNIHKFEPNSDGGSGLTVYTDNYVPLSNVIVDRNHVYDVGLAQGSNQLVQGVYISVPCQGCKVTNNLIHQISDFGVHAYHNPRYWIVANNTVFNCGRGVLTGPDFTVINNISMNNRSANYDIRGTAGLNRNLSYGTGSAERTGVTIVNPLFVRYTGDESGDYHLQPSSPGLDRGTADLAPSTDLDGRVRPQGLGYDIGVYEQ